MTRRLLFKRLFEAYIAGSVLKLESAIVKPKYYNIHIKDGIYNKKYHIYYASVNGKPYHWYKAILIFNIVIKYGDNANLTFDSKYLERLDAVERLS